MATTTNQPSNLPETQLTQDLRDEMSQENAQLKHRMSLMITPEQLKEDLESLNKEAQARLDTCCNNYQVEIKELQGSILELKNKCEKAESAVQQLDNEVKSLNSQLLECRRNAKVDKENVKLKYDNRRKDLEGSVNTWKSKCEELERKLADIAQPGVDGLVRGRKLETSGAETAGTEELTSPAAKSEEQQEGLELKTPSIAG